MFRGFARGDDANNAAAVALTVADKEKMRSAAHTEQEKALLSRRMRRVVELNGELVLEERLSFLKGNAMLPEVRRAFSRIPLKCDHLYIVWMIVAFASLAQEGLE